MIRAHEPIPRTGSPSSPVRKAIRTPTSQTASQSTSTQDQLLALQRSIGNRSVVEHIQRQLKIGPPGPDSTTTYSSALDAATVQGFLNPLIAAPGWLNGWLAPKVAPLVQGAPSYDFDSVADLKDWIILHAVVDELLTFAQAPGNAGAGAEPRGKGMRLAYRRLEQLRATYAAVGAQDGIFQLFGLNYQLRNDGPNHYYASRGGKTVVYSGLERKDAKKVFTHFYTSGVDAAFEGDDAVVDDFVCAFLAEPTRWPAEQVFNLLAVSRTGDHGTDRLTGDGTSALPMAGGTTYNQTLGVIGRQLPKRALIHARSEGIMELIAYELPNSAGFMQFMTGLKQQLQITP